MLADCRCGVRSDRAIGLTLELVDHLDGPEDVVVQLVQVFRWEPGLLVNRLPTVSIAELRPAPERPPCLSR